jgi:hypothetical protein
VNSLASKCVRLLEQGKADKDIGYLRSDPALHSIRAERDFELLLSPKSAVKIYDIEEAEKKNSGSECLG